MVNAVRRKVKVKPGGVVEIRSPDLVPGTMAEVIVLTEAEAGSGGEAELAELCAATRKAVPRPVSEKEIAEEIAAYRSTRP